MRTMLEYIEEANGLLGSVWGDAKTAEVRDYLKKHLPEWSVEEQEDLLTLCATLAFYEAEAVDRTLWEMQKPGREMQEAARKTSKNLSRFKLREQDKRETERRRGIIERHFGAALRGEDPEAEAGD